MVLVLILQLLHGFLFQMATRRYDYIKFGKNILTFDHKVE